MSTRLHTIDNTIWILQSKTYPYEIESTFGDCKFTISVCNCNHSIVVAYLEHYYFVLLIIRYVKKKLKNKFPIFYTYLLIFEISLVFTRDIFVFRCLDIWSKSIQTTVRQKIADGSYEPDGSQSPLCLLYTSRCV